MIDILFINDRLETQFTAKKGDRLTVLCENMGRCNFGAKMMRKKGIAGRCLFDNRVHFDWNVYTLPMNNLENLTFGNEEFNEKSAFYRGFINIENPKDTFVKLPNFTKGFVVINGFNLGRYWEIGPQQTLYVPASVLRDGENEIIVFESDGLKGAPEVEFVDKPILG